MRNAFGASDLAAIPGHSASVRPIRGERAEPDAPLSDVETVRPESVRCRIEAFEEGERSAFVGLLGNNVAVVAIRTRVDEDSGSGLDSAALAVTLWVWRDGTWRRLLRFSLAGEEFTIDAGLLEEAATRLSNNSTPR